MLQAALIPIGDSPLVTLIVTLILAGIIVFVAIWLLDNFAASVMSAPFASAVRALIYFVAIAWVLAVALDIIFGIRLLPAVGRG